MGFEPPLYSVSLAGCFDNHSWRCYGMAARWHVGLAGIRRHHHSPALCPPSWLDLAPQRIIDAGANIGLAALYFSSLWETAEIVAVEPEAENFKILRMNVAKSPRISAVQAGLWSSEGKKLLIITPSDSNKWGLQTTACANGTIPTITIRRLMGMMGCGSGRPPEAGYRRC